MSSSVRAHILGHIVSGDPQLLAEMRRLSSHTLETIFTQARDGGQAQVPLPTGTYTIARQADHTFILTVGTNHRFMV